MNFSSLVKLVRRSLAGTLKPLKGTAMLRKPLALQRRLLFMSTTVLPLCLTLSACGGDGASTASIPPPPVTPTVTPTPSPTPTSTPTPAPAADAYPISRAGSYGLIGRLTVDPGTGHSADWTRRTLAPGEFTMTIGTGGSSYTLEGPASVLPAGASSISASSTVSWSINPNGYIRGVFQEAPPFAADTSHGVGLVVDPGYSYVSMGYWAWPVILNGNPTQATNFGELLFVNGDRTPASGIPVSGTATYDAHTLLMRSSSGAEGIPFTLTADFGQRTIGTRIDQDFQNYGSTADPDPIQGIHVSGSAPFSNDGSFDIPLTGTVNYSYQNQSVPPPSQAATGDMNGAFFGPHAEQVGGIFSLQRVGDQLPLFQDAFVGQQKPH